ncbi:MAG: hypothetical protein IKK52_02735 [Alphaproteobacteria bacterium]|nr:hypothetical protein [Alphaproteobacteria bacterium]
MTQQQINSILNALFWDFEQNKFINSGVWPYKVNLIFAFADYIEALKEEDVIPFVSEDIFLDVDLIKQKAQQGINLWLNENMKTLMM